MHTTAPVRATLSAALVAGAALLSACGGSGGASPGLPSVNNPPPASTRFALQFFGTGTGDIDRVKVPLSSTTLANVGTTDFTVEFWIKGNLADNTAAGCNTGPAGWTTGNVVIDRDVFGDGDFGDFGVSLHSGRVAWGVARGAGGATVCGNLVVLNGQWNHVAVTRQLGTGEMKIFVNGALDLAQLPSSTLTSGNVSYNPARATTRPNSDPFLVLGAEKHDAGAGFASYRGLLDEVRISNVLRYTGTTVRPIAPFVADGNTMALYHFDEGSGFVLSDSAPGATSPGQLRVGGANSGPRFVNDTPFN